MLVDSARRREAEEREPITHGLARQHRMIRGVLETATLMALLPASNEPFVMAIGPLPAFWMFSVPAAGASKISFVFAPVL